MKMIPIARSSSIASMGYDEENEKLRVHFNTGRVYEYSGVDAGTFVAVITDEESTGKAFQRLIKSKSFPYKELKDPHEEAK